MSRRFSLRREVTLGLLVYAVYLTVRRLVLRADGRARARRNAERIVELERRLGIDVEPALQRAVLRAPRVVHGLNVALSEALVLAEKAGVEREMAYEVFASGAGGAPFVEYKRNAYLHPESAVVAFTLDLVAKDLELITALGSSVNAPMQQAQTGLNIVRSAIEAGMGQRDLSAIAVFLRGGGA